MTAKMGRKVKMVDRDTVVEVEEYLDSLWLDDNVNPFRQGRLITGEEGDSTGVLEAQRAYKEHVKDTPVMLSEKVSALNIWIDLHVKNRGQIWTAIRQRRLRRRDKEKHIRRKRNLYVSDEVYRMVKYYSEDQNLTMQEVVESAIQSFCAPQKQSKF